MVLHPELLDHAEGRAVRRVGPGTDPGEAGLAKGPREESSGRLGRVTAPPQGRGDPVEDLDVGGWLDEPQATEADEVRPVSLPNSPEAEAVAIERFDSRPDDLLRPLARNDFVVPQEAADLGVRPERVKGCEVVEGPGAKLQPLRRDAVQRGQVSPGASSITSVARPRFPISSRSASGLPGRTGNVPQCMGMTRGARRSSHAFAASRGPIV